MLSIVKIKSIVSHVNQPALPQANMVPPVWDSVYGFRMSSIKEAALQEPLVDTVEGKAVNTTACAFKVNN
jgi:hypothetical protein